MTDDKVKELTGQLKTLDWKRGPGETVNRITRQLAVEFGRRRGWKLASRFCSPSRLAYGTRSESYSYSFEMFDHLYNYTADRKHVAIVCHLYNVPENLVARAEKMGLIASLPTDMPSWWHSWTTLVLYEKLKRD
jgi:hypothetical protein